MRSKYLSFTTLGKKQLSLSFYRHRLLLYKRRSKRTIMLLLKLISPSRALQRRIQISSSRPYLRRSKQSQKLAKLPACMQVVAWAESTQPKRAVIKAPKSKTLKYLARLLSVGGRPHQRSMLLSRPFKSEALTQRKAWHRTGQTTNWCQTKCKISNLYLSSKNRSKRA